MWQSQQKPLGKTKQILVASQSLFFLVVYLQVGKHTNYGHHLYFCGIGPCESTYLPTFWLFITSEALWSSG